MTGNERFGIGITIVLIIVLTTLGMGSCVQRNWQFEDACRRAGGVVMHASAVSAAGNTGGDVSNRDICAKVIQSPIAQPMALPEYRR